MGGDGDLETKLRPILRRVAWRYVPFLMLCYSCAYLDRVNIGFAKAAMSVDLGLSAAAYGLGAGIFFLGYFFFEVPSNLLLQRFGARRWISRIMVSWSLVSAACAFIDNTLSFYALRLLLGIAEAGFFPGVVLFLSQWFPSVRRAQIIALFMTAIPLSGLVGAPLSGSIIELFDGYLGMAGWRWMFLIEAIPAFGLGLMVLAVLDSRIADARWLNEAEKAMLTEALAKEGGIGERPVPVLRVLLDPKVLGFGLIYLCCVMGQYGITFWLPTLIADAKAGGIMQIGMFGAIPYAFAVLCMVCVGRHSDATGERHWHTLLPMAIGAAALLAVPHARENFGLSMTLITIAAGAILTATPLFWTLPTRSLHGKAVVGIAAINSLGNLAGFMSPMLVGWLADRTHDTDAGMAALSLFLFFGAALVLIRIPRRSSAPG